MVEVFKIVDFYHLKAAVKLNFNTGRKPGTGCAHSKISRVARVVFVLYVVGRAYYSAVFDYNVVLSDP